MEGFRLYNFFSAGDRRGGASVGGVAAGAGSGDDTSGKGSEAGACVAGVHCAAHDMERVSRGVGRGDGLVAAQPMELAAGGGVKAGKRKTMFYLAAFHGSAYYVDVEGCRAATGAADLVYALDSHFDIVR